MKILIQKIKQIYNQKDNKFYFSLLGSLIMGTIHLISCIIHFDWIVLNYCLFFYLLVLFKVWQCAIEKYNIKPSNYFAGVISLIIIIIPMMVSFVMTILFRDAPYYIFDWLIYAYAFYGTLKIIFAIRNIIKKEKTDREFILSYVGMISALYTIKILEFALIMTFGENKTGSSMHLMQLFTQGLIFLFSIYVIIIFIIKGIKNLKLKNKNVNVENKQIKN